MSSLFNIGVSALRSQQAALNVVGQNITNASTPGYTRQRVDLETQVGGFTSGIGSGVNVGSIKRIADEFINDQIRADSSLEAELSAFSERITQLEGTLFDGQYGIDAALSDFFDAIQDASNEPSDLAVREFVVSAAEAVASRFKGVTVRTQQQSLEIVGALESSAVRVNELSSLIVSLNERIAGMQDQKTSTAFNLLLDQREQLLKDLSQLVTVNTVEQGDGQVDVFVGKGQPLVLGSEAAYMEVTGDGDIALRPVGSNVLQVVTSAIAGGEIGGVLKYREEVLWPTQNELGRLAASVSMAINEQHRLGVDLNGHFGGDLFRDVNDPLLVSERVDYLAGNSNSNSTDVGRVNVYIEDPFNQVATDYEVRFSENSPGSYTIQRRSDGETVYRGTSIVPPHEIAFDGLRVEFASGTFAPGDTFVIRPYADFGSQINTVVSDPSMLALSLPMHASPAITNQGNAQVVSSSVLDAGHPLFSNTGPAGNDTLMPPLLVRFVTESEYVVLDNSNPANPVPLQPDPGLQTYLGNSQNHLFPHMIGSSLVSTSGPALGLLGTPVLASDLNPGDNGYSNGQITLDYAASQYNDETRTLVFEPNASAREIAQQLNSVPGVNASANTQLTLTDLVNFESGTPVELAINGELLTGFSSLNELADAIANNDTLTSQGISARSDGTTLVLASRYGDDLTLHFQGDPNESVSVTNSKGETISLNGNVAGVYRSITVGGELTAILEPGVELDADYAGVFASNPVHQRADLGIDVVLSGSAEAGDEFLINFNQGGVSDNRNALALASLNNQTLIGIPPRTFANTFGTVIQQIGIQSSQAQINQEAASVLLDQSVAYRESVSGVNLDEEAASLIQHEQAYNAAAQVISVARDIFDILLNSVR